MNKNSLTWGMIITLCFYLLLFLSSELISVVKVTAFFCMLLYEKFVTSAHPSVMPAGTSPLVCFFCFSIAEILLCITRSCS